MTGGIDVRTTRIFEDVRQQLGEIRLAAQRHKEEAEEIIARLRRPLTLRRLELQEELEEVRRSDSDDDRDGAGSRSDEIAGIERKIRRLDQILDDALELETRFRACLGEFAQGIDRRVLTSSEGVTEKADALAVYIQLQPDDVVGRVDTSALRAAPPQTEPAHPGSHAARLEQFRQACTRDHLPDGFVWVDLTTLPEACFVHEEASFKKVSKPAMRRGVHLLFSDILPELRRVPNAGLEHFAHLDRERGTDYDQNGFVHPDSLVTVWQAFLDPRPNNDNVIRISTVHEDGSVELYSGRHRLAVARQLGQRYMPVRIGTERR